MDREAENLVGDAFSDRQVPFSTGLQVTIGRELADERIEVSADVD